MLSREDYTFDADASLSPTDLAVGWEPMSDETVLKSHKLIDSFCGACELM